MIARLSETLTTTNWVRRDAADFVPLSGLAAPQAGWRIKSLEVISVTTNDCAVVFHERNGNSLTGTRGAIVIPEAQDFRALAGSTLALGTLTVTFIHTGTSSGTTVSTLGKTRAQVVAEVVALITALATGIADIEAADAEEDGLIVLQSDAADVSVPTWTKGAAASGLRLVAHGLQTAGSITVASGGTLAKRTFATGDRVHAISLRAAAANSSVVVEAELEPAGWPQR